MYHLSLYALLCFLSNGPNCIKNNSYRFTVSSLTYISPRDETILQYIDILQYLLQQYNTIRLKGNSNILQYIAMFVVLML